MSSYLSNLLTQTTSRYNSLRRTLLSSEDDGDTEDDTHVCRVLRAYYSEKGRPLPPWLPPDPNDRRAITPQPYGSTGPSGYLTSAGGRSQYGGSGGLQAGAPASTRSSLNDLWDSPRASNAPAQPQSLRNMRRTPVGGGAAAPAGTGGGMPPAGNPALGVPPSGPRPLPSQRAGSYQSMSSQPGGMDSGGPMPGGGGGGGGAGGSAQDRLKARLWGGARSTSPSPGQGGGGGGGGGGSAGAGGQGQYSRQPANPYDSGGGGSNRRYGR